MYDHMNMYSSSSLYLHLQPTYSTSTQLGPMSYVEVNFTLYAF